MLFAIFVVLLCILLVLLGPRAITLGSVVGGYLVLCVLFGALPFVLYRLSEIVRTVHVLYWQDWALGAFMFGGTSWILWVLYRFDQERQAKEASSEPERSSGPGNVPGMQAASEGARALVEPGPVPSMRQWSTLRTGTGSGPVLGGLKETVDEPESRPEGGQ